MRPLLLLLLTLAACAADPVLLPDAGPCSSACGAGTVCLGGACVAVDGGSALDTGWPWADAAGDDRAVLPDFGPRDTGTDVPAVDATEDRPAPMDVADVPRADVAADVPTDVRVSCDGGSPDASAYLCGGVCCSVACCNGVCANTSRNRDHCGGCGHACEPLSQATPGCAGGACVVAACTGRFLNCDGAAFNGCEVDPSADIENCGTCGRSCVSVLIVHATPSCDVGACSYRCDPGYANCDGRISNGCEREVTGDAGCS